MQPLQVFLCHSVKDKHAAIDLYQRLQAEGVAPWFAEMNLVPGQNWREVISKTVRDTDVVLVCLSHSSVKRPGYAQKEIKLALDVADEQPEGSIFVIPVRLEECDIPDRLSHLHWVNLFEEHGYERLVWALQQRANQLGRGLSLNSSIVGTHKSPGRQPPPLTPPPPVVTPPSTSVIPPISNIGCIVAFTIFVFYITIVGYLTDMYLTSTSMRAIDPPYSISEWLILAAYTMFHAVGLPIVIGIIIFLRKITK